MCEANGVDTEAAKKDNTDHEYRHREPDGETQEASIECTYDGGGWHRKQCNVEPQRTVAPG